MGQTGVIERMDRIYDGNVSAAIANLCESGASHQAIADHLRLKWGFIVDRTTVLRYLKRQTQPKDPV